MVTVRTQVQAFTRPMDYRVFRGTSLDEHLIVARPAQDNRLGHYITRLTLRSSFAFYRGRGSPFKRRCRFKSHFVRGLHSA
ncbi:hypothetical protein BAUCODRAFT_212495 [Baudoinia panamericana UAMH 10762]|uniref:Uncharacterized protein n=1 Tax=Baudoinia panamericana (strain UAMH 10762) TaxID=717646 RepID=M2MQT8_BAUPA|nr:uncharacterized protein BAUCODRAFT_212495 [Baudoinia panamericana UAMH 10762]EMC93853.1 hypothetical protein BAUCODRAFT_212495 [Baudoinia panamericana UAMH 10762]